MRVPIFVVAVLAAVLTAAAMTVLDRTSAAQSADLQRVATDAAQLKTSFGIFERARTSSDALPVDVRGSNPALRDLAVDESRLALDRNGTQIWLIPQGADTICMFSQSPDGVSMACALAETAANVDSPLIDFAADDMYTLVPDEAQVVSAVRKSGAQAPAIRGQNVAAALNVADAEAVSIKTADGATHVEGLARSMTD